MYVRTFGEFLYQIISCKCVETFIGHYSVPVQLQLLNRQPIGFTQCWCNAIILPGMWNDPTNKVLYCLKFLYVLRGCVRPNRGAIQKFIDHKCFDD